MERALEGTVLSPAELALASRCSGKGVNTCIGYELLCDKPQTEWLRMTIYVLVNLRVCVLGRSFLDSLVCSQLVAGVARGSKTDLEPPSGGWCRLVSWMGWGPQLGQLVPASCGFSLTSGGCP